MGSGECDLLCFISSFPFFSFPSFLRLPGEDVVVGKASASESRSATSFFEGRRRLTAPLEAAWGLGFASQAGEDGGVFGYELGALEGSSLGDGVLGEGEYGGFAGGSGIGGREGGGGFGFGITFDHGWMDGYIWESKKVKKEMGVTIVL